MLTQAKNPPGLSRETRQYIAATEHTMVVIAQMVFFKMSPSFMLGREYVSGVMGGGMFVGSVANVIGCVGCYDALLC